MRSPTLRLIPLALASLTLLACDSKKELVCSGDLSACDGQCVALQADPAHCGTCGHACDAGQTCSQGACAYATVTDCGAAGRACAEGERCLEGRCVAPLYLACYNTSEVREAKDTVDASGQHALSAVGVPLAIAPGAIGLATVGGELYAASAGVGGAETVTRIARDPPSVRTAPLWSISVPAPDIEYLAAHGDYLYAAHNSLGTLLVLSTTGQVVEEHEFVGARTNPNPQGIAFRDDRAYVALQARDEVAVLDVSAVGTCPSPGHCITEVSRIDVSGLASDGAKAMPSRVAISGGRAYVTLWNLDAGWSPPAGSHGKLAAIDLATNTLDATATTGAGPVGLVDLGAACLNPADAEVSGSILYVTCGAFDYSTRPVTTHGQGIVPVDLSRTVPAPGAILPAPESSAPGELAFCRGTGYVADRASGRVFVLDPVMGAVQGTALCPNSASGSAYVADIACGE